VRMHPCGIAGSFAHVKCGDDANAVVIPHGVDDSGEQIVDPVEMQPVPVPFIPPALVNPPVPPAPGVVPLAPPAPGAVPGPDPNMVLLQGVQ